MKRQDESEKKSPYLVESKAHYGSAEVLGEHLNHRAAEGWELVAVIGDSMLIFKAAS